MVQAFSASQAEYRTGKSRMRRAAAGIHFTLVAPRNEPSITGAIDKLGRLAS